MGGELMTENRKIASLIPQKDDMSEMAKRIFSQTRKKCPVNGHETAYPDLYSSPDEYHTASRDSHGVGVEARHVITPQANTMIEAVMEHFPFRVKADYHRWADKVGLKICDARMPGIIRTSLSMLEATDRLWTQQQILLASARNISEGTKTITSLRKEFGNDYALNQVRQAMVSIELIPDPSVRNKCLSDLKKVEETLLIESRHL
jgi:hypothetical protein